MPPRPDDKRREELLDGIEAIILAEGFVHLRVGALAARLHCSRSTLYKLAPSKTELLALVFERYASKAIEDADAVASLLGTGHNKIVRNVQIISQWAAKGSPGFWRDVRDTPEMADVLSVQRGRGYRVIQRYLDEGIASGEFRPLCSEFIGYLVWMAAAAIRDPDLLDRFGLSSEEAFAQLGEFILSGVER